MTEKKAFVFDTNFIIQHQNLDEALDKIKEQFAIYITQVSIDERIAQNCREVKTQFNKAEECKTEFAPFAIVIQFKKTYEEMREYYQEGIQKKYESYFDNNIIPYAKDGEMLTAIIDRANQKIPPFSSAKDASDKGFKDCLLWLSILAYFKDNGEDQIVFITDDKSAFRNNTEFLQSEFHDVTGKTIEIHPNTFYKELLSPPVEEPAEEETKVFPDLDSFREKLEGAIEGLLGVYNEDYYGNSYWVQAFTTSTPFDGDYVKTFFEGLSNSIEQHLFERTIPASTIFNFDGRVTDCETEIPMKNLEYSQRVYQDVLTIYPQHREQFFEAVAKILNRNYKAPTMFQAGFAEDEELPF